MKALKNEVFLVDNMEGMAWFPDNYFDLAIVDPPYGIDGKSHRNNQSRNKRSRSKKYGIDLWSQLAPESNFFTELKRISKHQIIFGANYFPEIVGVPFNPPRRTDFDAFLRIHNKHWLIWDKCNTTNNFNDCELAWFSHKAESFLYQFMWNGMMQGAGVFKGALQQGDKSKNQKRIHPTEKPIALYKFLLHRFARPGFKIVDTHVGSGSHRLAIDEMNMKLKFIGFEISPTYFNDQQTRYDLVKSQLSIPFQKI